LRATAAPMTRQAIPIAKNATFKDLPAPNGRKAAMRNRIPPIMNPHFPTMF